jgi:DNA gyrase subunit A
VAVAKITEKNGVVVGALTVDEDDEVLAIMGKGNIVRSSVSGVTRRGRNTQGMRFVTPARGDVVVAVARSVERAVDEAADEAVQAPAEGQADAPTGRAGSLAQSADEARAGVDAVPSEATDQPVEAVEAPEGAPTEEAGESDSPGGNE